VAGAVTTADIAPCRWTWRDGMFAVALLVAVFAAYRPAWNGRFIWDDDAHVTRPALRSLHGLGQIWFEVGATQQYYPVLHSAFWLEYRMFADGPTGYHFVNFALHTLNATLVALLVRRLGLRGAWLAAGIFALHPIMVESVAWITELKNTLSGAFYLGAALAYLRFDAERRARWYSLAFAFFLLALGSKTVTATLPGALLVACWWKRGRLTWRDDVRPLLPFFAFGAVSGLFTGWVELKLIGADGAAFAMAPVERGLVAGRAVWFYLGKLVWPADLVFIYPHWSVSAQVPWQYLFPSAALAGLAVLWAWRQRWRGPLAGALVFVGTLFPVLGFFNVYPFLFSFVADHFQYLASLGIIIPTAAGLSLLAGRTRGRAAWIPGAALLTALGALTHAQSEMYRDETILYQKTLEQNPTCWMAHINLGNALQAGRRFDEAIAHYKTALRLKPDFAKAHYDLGTALAVNGRSPEAIAEFETALRLKPDYANAHHNLGTVLALSGRTAEAERHFAVAVRLNPSSVEARRNWGGILLESGQLSEARHQFEEVLRLQPDDTRTRALLQELQREPDTKRN
jgi:tetratricopeptide (TPR) repeat protein